MHSPAGPAPPCASWLQRPLCFPFEGRTEGAQVVCVGKGGGRHRGKDTSTVKVEEREWRREEGGSQAGAVRGEEGGRRRGVTVGEGRLIAAAESALHARWASARLQQGGSGSAAAVSGVGLW